MSRYGRRSGNDLAYGDDYYSPGRGGGGGGERWDRERFEAMRSRGGPRSSDSFRYEEDDYSGRRGDRRDVRVEIEEDRPRRGGGRDPYDRNAFDDERYEPPRRSKPAYLEEDRYYTSGREMAPYRPGPPRYDRYVERDVYDVPDRKPSRPQYIRRQSSLNFDDRRERTRYGDEEERDVNVNVNLRGPEPPRYAEPPRAPEPPRYRYDDEDYRDVHIFREKERDIYRRRQSSSSSSEEEIIEKPKRKSKREKKAHTVFPKRLANLRAILEFGHPYDEDEFFYYVKWNSTQEEINEVLEKSRSFTETKTLAIEAAAPPEPVYEEPPQEEPEIIETTTTKIIENPTEQEIRQYERAGSIAGGSVAGGSVKSGRSGKSRKSRGARSVASSRRSESSDSTTTIRQSEVFEKTAALSVRSPSPSHGGRRGRSKSRARGSEIFVESREEVEDSGTLVLPPRGKSRSRRDIEEEIRRLEAEKKAIRHEKKYREEDSRSERFREREEEDYEFVDDKDIRVERNSTGQLQFERDAPKRTKSKRARRPTQRDVNAALFSLT